MKNIILTYTLLLLSGIAFTQERIIDGDNRPVDYTPQKGDYIVCNSLNDFEGTFVWENNSDERVEIVLEKKKYCFEEGLEYCFQTLIGSYEYKKNNTLQVSKKEVRYSEDKITSTEFKNTSLPQIRSGIVEVGKVTLRIDDEDKNKTVKGVLTKLKDGKYSLKISNDGEGEIRIVKTGEKKRKQGFTLPEEMILTKIN